MRITRKFHAERKPYWLDAIDIHCFGQTEAGEAFVTAPAVTTILHSVADKMLTHPPLLTINPSDAQNLMDELWRAGIRTTEGAGSVGQLAAVNDHLQDMRRLVFETPAPKKPSPL